MSVYLEKAIKEHYESKELYTVSILHKALISFGYEIKKDDLYQALKITGWVKLRLIRDRLLSIKRQFPKHYPFDGLRHLIRYPLLVKRNEDLPEYKEQQKETPHDKL
jgi:hypothetical protein